MRIVFVEWDSHLEPLDPLAFKDRLRYLERVREAQRSTRLREALMSGKGDDSGAARCDRCHGIRIYGWFDGFGGGRENRPTGRTGHRRKMRGHHFLRIGRRANARRDSLPHANGQNQCRFGPTQSKGITLYLRPDGSYNGWGFGKFCNVGRYYPGRTEGHYRFCRGTGHRTDHQTKIARRFSAVGISSGPWHD
jgi:hypothetical protein